MEGPDLAAPSQADAKEFLRLLTLHDQATFAYILLLLPNWNDAEEVAQEVRVRLWEQYAERFQPGTDFGAWARSVAYFQVLSFRQARKRQPAGFSDELLESFSREWSLSSDDLLQRQTALEGCLAKLAPSAREALRLHYGGCSWETMAERLQRSVAALRKSVQRARQAVSDCVARALRRAEDLQ